MEINAYKPDKDFQECCEILKTNMVELDDSSRKPRSQSSKVHVNCKFIAYSVILYSFNISMLIVRKIAHLINIQYV